MLPFEVILIFHVSGIFLELLEPYILRDTLGGLAPAVYISFSFLHLSCF